MTAGRIVVFVLGALASVAAYARDKNGELREAAAQASDCAYKHADMLDDGVSPASDIARAIRSQCSVEFDRIQAIQLRGAGTVYRNAYRTARGEREIGDLTTIVLQRRAARR